MLTTLASDPMVTLAFFNFSGWELLLIGGLGLLVFGARLPSVGRNLGKGITEFKKGLKDAGDEISRDDGDDVRRERAYRPPLAPGGEERRVMQGERVDTHTP